MSVCVRFSKNNDDNNNEWEMGWSVFTSSNANREEEDYEDESILTI